MLSGQESYVVGSSLDSDGNVADPYFFDSEFTNSYNSFGFSGSANNTFKDSDGNQVIVDLDYDPNDLEEISFDVHTISGVPGSYQVATQSLVVSSQEDFSVADTNYTGNSWNHAVAVYADGGGFYVAAELEGSLTQYSAFDAIDGQSGYAYNGGKSFVAKNGEFTNTHGLVLSDSNQLSSESASYDNQADSIGYVYAIEGADSKGIFFNNNNDLYYVNGETGVISEVLDYTGGQYPRYHIASRDSTGDGIKDQITFNMVDQIYNPADGGNSHRFLQFDIDQAGGFDFAMPSSEPSDAVGLFSGAIRLSR